MGSELRNVITIKTSSNYVTNSGLTKCANILSGVLNVTGFENPELLYNGGRGLPIDYTGGVGVPMGGSRALRHRHSDLQVTAFRGGGTVLRECIDVVRSFDESRRIFRYKSQLWRQNLLSNFMLL